MCYAVDPGLKQTVSCVWVRTLSILFVILVRYMLYNHKIILVTTAAQNYL